MLPKTGKEAAALSGRLRFGVYEADPHAGELRKHGYRIRLEDRPFRALLILLQHANQVVTREDLQRQLWPSDVFIDFDHGLNTAIRKIRRALNDSADNPRFVETVGRRGYRFKAEVVADLPSTTLSGNPANGFAAPTEEFARQGSLVATSPLPSSDGPLSDSASQPVRTKRLGSRLGLAGLAATALVVAGSLATYRLRVQPAALPFNTQQLRTRQITEHGVARFASISPDGRYVVYVKSSGGNPTLRAKQIDAGSDIEVVPPQDGAYLSTISFSPDSNQVYFGHNSKENAAVFDLYSVPILGGPVQRVLSDIDGASVSPDGAQIAFVRHDPVNARTMLMIAKADGSEVRELAGRDSKAGFMGDMPAWSPNGQFVAVVAIHDGNEAVREIVVLPVAGGEARHLLSRRTFGQLTWLKDQGLLVAAFDFSAGFAPGSDRAQLYYQPFPSGDAVRFSNDMNHYTQVGISAARDRVVSVKQDMSNNVFVAPAANPAEMRQITNERIAGFDLDWINNDRLVVQDENHHFYTMNGDGSNRVVLFDKFAADSAGRCGDGAIVFNRVQPDNSVSLEVLDLKTGASRSLLRGSFNMGGSCSPDGRWVYYTAYGATPVRMMRISGSGGQAVAVGPPASTLPLVSPDGAMLLFQTTEGQGSARHVFFAVMRIGAGAILRKWPVPLAVGARVWGPDGKSFVYYHRVNDETALWQQPLNKPEAHRIAGTISKVPKGIWNFAFSPDGKRLALIHGVETRDVVLFTNFRK
jgi:Tol biopolymer transport system component/DNA-binding winged helix-turn-helix (wHTH) protein